MLMFNLLYLFAIASAWGGVGHMMTAQVAKNHLKTTRLDVLQWAEQLVQDLNHLTDGRSNTFSEAAAWADDIRETGTSYLSNWHFTDRPINPDGLLYTMDPDQIVTNSVIGLQRIFNVLTNKNTLKYRHTVFKAQMMRMLLHLVGDMHQPLHNTNFYNATYPTGDLGGNKLKIQLQNGTFVNFHSYWDAGAYTFQPDKTFLTRPLSKQDSEYLQNWTQDLMIIFPFANYKHLDMTNPDVWTMLGFRQAQNFVYPGVMTDNSFDADYFLEVQRICEENIVIGGYRLASKLIEIYDIIVKNEQSYQEQQ